MNISFGLIVVLILILVAMQYRKCPKDHILVIYDKTNKKPKIKRIHNHPSFIIPFLQDSIILTNENLTMGIDLFNLKLLDDTEMDFSLIYTVKISQKTTVMQNAIAAFAGQESEYVSEKLRNTIQNQLIDDIKTMVVREIGDTEKFLEETNKNINAQLMSIGYELVDTILVNVEDSGKSIL